MTPEELERRKSQLGAQIVLAEAYQALVESPGWIQLREKLEADIRAVMDQAVTAGYPTRDDEHDAILKARAIKTVLEYPAAVAAKCPRLREQLDAAQR